MNEDEQHDVEETFIKLWGSIGEPQRPSEAVKAFYARWLDKARQKGDKYVLVLGSTPEIRDIALSRGMIPVCCDLSRPIWEKMTSLMAESGEEEFIQCNWLEIPPDRTYRYIAGDNSTVFLSPEQQELLIRRLAGILDEGGVLALRVNITPYSRDMSAFTDALELYRQGKWDGSDESFFNSLVILTTSLGAEHYPSMGKFELFDRVLRAYMSDDEYAKIAPHCHKFKSYAPPKSQLEELFARHLRIVDVMKQEGQMYWDGMYAYALQKGHAAQE